MSHVVNKEYILNILKKIESPGNFDLTEKIETINVSEQRAEIIVNTEFTSETEKLTHLWPVSYTHLTLPTILRV